MSRQQVSLVEPHAPEIAALIVGHRAAHAKLDEVDVPANRVERRPELVRHRREEVGLRAVRFLEPRREHARFGDLALEVIVRSLHPLGHRVERLGQATRFVPPGNRCAVRVVARRYGVRGQREVAQRAGDATTQDPRGDDADDEHRDRHHDTSAEERARSIEQRVVRHFGDDAERRLRNAGEHGHRLLAVGALVARHVRCVARSRG